MFMCRLRRDLFVVLIYSKGGGVEQLDVGFDMSQPIFQPCAAVLIYLGDILVYRLSQCTALRLSKIYYGCKNVD